MNPLPVFVVDDDESVRDSLAFMLEGYDFKVESYADGVTFLDQANIEQAGCVVLDIRMPIMMGQQVHRLLKDKHSPLAVIFLTGHGDVPMAVEALKHGAIDFFQKPVDGEKLVVAIHHAEKQSLHNQSQLLLHKAFETLTTREQDLLRLLVKGYKNQQISDELCIAVRTVEVHRSSLMKKLHAKTIAELVMFYSQIKT
ncbi:DNA-binding response regulator [Photobacterium frigidiphilum]|uniref:DNA-binding response regulator n=1 Tax=Photobacterium frigidiphilum TaxID=264736 RepID=A0A2T3JIQ1_9GAMM|nr:response regulator [Photobacterium frigidiphilum]PSU48872.1 DNA-binding response regulator [Photobacterium frigidiphilum]